MSSFTRIIYNGPFLEERVHSIDELVATLKKEPLHSTWEIGSGFMYQVQTIPVHSVFQGRFATSQYRFKIETDDAAVILELTSAIQENINSQKYKELRTIQFALSFKKALVKQIEAAEVSEATLFLKEKYKVSGRPKEFESVYHRFDWEEGQWISMDDLLKCTLDYGFDLMLTEEDKFSRY